MGGMFDFKGFYAHCLVFALMFIASFHLQAQEVEAKKERVVPEYIKNNAHPKLNPLLTDSTKAEPGSKLVVIEMDSKRFVDPIGFVIRVVEDTLIKAVKFSQLKTWIMADVALDAEALVKELSDMVNSELSIMQPASTSVTSPDKE